MTSAEEEGRSATEEDEFVSARERRGANATEERGSSSRSRGGTRSRTAQTQTHKPKNMSAATTGGEPQQQPKGWPKEALDSYDAIRPLGKGAFGKVYKAVDKMNSELEVAIKVLNKDKMTKKDLKHVMDEVDMLKKVDHPNIVEYFETYETEHFLYLVMEFCDGGELFDHNEDVYLKNKRSYTENDAANVIYKCLEALQHCHAMGITHRDIKPENIMYACCLSSCLHWCLQHFPSSCACYTFLVGKFCLKLLKVSPCNSVFPSSS